MSKILLGDLNPEYVALAEQRLNEVPVPLF